MSTKAPNGRENKNNENSKIKIENHLGLVHSCCQKFRGREFEYDDVFQAGCMGLTKAAKNFDYSRGVNFSTYAVPVILGEIKAMFRDNGSSLKVSRDLKTLSYKVWKERERFSEAHEREPTICELAEILETDTEKILEAIDIARTPISLSFDSNDDDAKEVDVPVPFDEENISDKVSIIEALKPFAIKDKNLIYLRFFRGITQCDVAKKLGMTQVQVSRREKTLLKMLREKLA